MRFFVNQVHSYIGTIFYYVVEDDPEFLGACYMNGNLRTEGG